MFVEFKNKGDMKMEAVTLVGVSAKSDDSAIGKFGTGLKYVIAAHVRHRFPFVVMTGGHVYTFEPEPLDYRGKLHEQILMRRDGMPAGTLGFTTHYGEHWQDWMLFRELWSNMLDEEGEGSLIKDFSREKPTSGMTKIYSGHPGVVEAYNNRADIFIQPDLKPLYDNEDVRVFPVASVGKAGIFYKSVYVGNPSVYKPLFAYDFKHGVKLTEDRSVVASLQLENIIARTLVGNPDLFERILWSPQADDCWELNGISWRGVVVQDPEIIKVMRQALRVGKGPETVLRRLLATSELNADVYEGYQLSQIEQGWLDHALEFCSIELGLEPITVRTVKSIGGPAVLGIVEKNKIILSSFCFHKGRSEVVRTVAEELVHHHTGLLDCTRSLQTYLFDRWIGLAEQHAELREINLHQPKSGV